MEHKITHFLYCPVTGLGLYGGHRGKRWLKNRIKIFKQFVIPSLQAQTDKDFVLWISWRFEDRNDKQVKELKDFVDNLGIRNVFTYSGLCFWDDKYPDDVARERLVNSIQGALGDLINQMGESEEVYMTIQPSDDCYHSKMVEETKLFFKQNPEYDVYGYKRGYVMDYINMKLAEWNPQTTPPFYTIKFTRDVFTEPFKHLKFTGPYKSHEYLKDFMKTMYVYERGFVVGTHGENVSTIFDHPYTGNNVSLETLKEFGLDKVEPLKIKRSLRKVIMRKLPYGWQRKLRYWLGEKFYAKFYAWIRN